MTAPNHTARPGKAAYKGEGGANSGPYLRFADFCEKWPLIASHRIKWHLHRIKWHLAPYKGLFSLRPKW